MNNYFKMLLGAGIKLKPMCKTCIYEKKGLATMCEKYKRIPEGVQLGKWCKYYDENEDIES